MWSRWSPGEALGSCIAVVRAHVGDVVAPLATQLAAVLAQALRQTCCSVVLELLDCHVACVPVSRDSAASEPCMTWEVGTNRPVIGQASGATRGACARQWSRDRIVWCDAAQEGGVLPRPGMAYQLRL